MNVTNKPDFFRRWLDMEFGNRLRIWNDYNELLADPYQGTVTVRMLHSAATQTEYNVRQEDAPRGCRYNESAPDNELLIQGELCESSRGWELTYSRKKCNMRSAMEHARFVHGLVAKTILRAFCCPSSYADLCVLLDNYPMHVVEFGVYVHNLGAVPHRNTIIWEVRDY